MKKILCVLLLYLAALHILAYRIEQYDVTFYDASRNRNILTWIYYPVDDDNPLTSYPYFVFGHGWNGDCTYYGSITNGVVNQGWIIAYPRTEESMFGYNTTNFAQDLAFMKDAVFDETLDFTSPLYGKVSDLAIVGGYSMGGACAVGAASLQPSYASIVTMAAAPRTWLNLYPQAITLATGVTIPSLTYSGSSDNTAPPNDNQIPLYNNLASVYKSFVSLTGQGHISFYDNQTIYAVLAPWLSYIKTGSLYYLDQFEALLDSYPGSTLTYQIVNNLVIEVSPPQNVYINAESDGLILSWESNPEAHGYRVYRSYDPYVGFIDVTGEGSFSGGGGSGWSTPNTPYGQWFYRIIAFRN